MLEIIQGQPATFKGGSRYIETPALSYLPLGKQYKMATGSERTGRCAGLLVTVLLLLLIERACVHAAQNGGKLFDWTGGVQATEANVITAGDGSYGGAFATSFTYANNQITRIKILDSGLMVATSGEAFGTAPRSLTNNPTNQLIALFITANSHISGEVWIEPMSSTLCGEFNWTTIANLNCQSASGFMMTWVDRLITEGQKSLTYQLLLLIVGSKTYVIFKYDSTSFNSLDEAFSSETGFATKVSGSVYAYSFLNLMFNRQINSEELGSFGNYKYPGTYLFLISGETPEPVHYICNRESILYISVFTISVMGGRILEIVGPCINPDSRIKCKQGDYNIMPISIDGNNITCVSRQELDLGAKEFSVSEDDGLTHVHGVTVIAVEPVDDPDLLVKVRPRVEMAIDLNSQVVTWTNPKSATIIIAIVTFYGQSTHEFPLGPKKEVLLTLTGKEHNNYTFNLADRVRALPPKMLKKFFIQDTWPDYFFICIYSGESHEYSFSEPIITELLRKLVLETLMKLGEKVYDINGDPITSYRTWRENFAKRKCAAFIKNPPTRYNTIPAPCTMEQAENDPQFARSRIPGKSNCFVAVVRGYGQQEACYSRKTGLISCGRGHGVQKFSNPQGYRNGIKMRRYMLDHAETDILINRYCCINRVDLSQCGIYRKMLNTHGCEGYVPLKYAAIFTGMGSVLTFKEKSFTLSCIGPFKIYADAEIEVYGNTKSLFRNLNCKRCFARYLNEIYIIYKKTETIHMWLIGNRIEFNFNDRRGNFPDQQADTRIYQPVYFTFRSGYTVRRDKHSNDGSGASWRVYFMFDNGVHMLVELEFTYPNLMSLEMYLREEPSDDSTSLFGYNPANQLQGITIGRNEKPTFICQGNYDVDDGGYDFKSVNKCPNCAVYSFSGVTNSDGVVEVPPFSTTAVDCAFKGACLMDYHLVGYSYPGNFIDPKVTANITRNIIEEYEEFFARVAHWKLANYNTTCNCPLRTTGAEVELADPFENAIASWSCYPGFKSATPLPTSQCSNQTWTVATPATCIFVGLCTWDCGSHGKCQLASLQQYCKCDQDYTGQFCETKIIDLCLPNPCKNNGVCRTENNQAKCTCISQGEWFGDKCQIPSPCKPLPLGPCKRKGTRTCEVSFTPIKANCKCLAGYSGSLCEIEPSTCSNYCHPPGVSHCYIKYSQPFCYCKAFWRGLKCEINVGICPADYCLNGVCYLNSQNNKPECQCRTGFYGQRCENSGVLCNENFCTNEGTCFLETNEQTGLNFKCLCPPGYTGSRCESFIILCLDLGPKCTNGATCIYDMYGERCKCRPGWAGKYCSVPADNCQESLCRNGGICSEDSYGEQTCFCPPQVVGEVCQTDVDECGELPNKPRCENGGKCTNLYGNFTCTCSPGWVGRLCNQTVDTCAAQPCKNGGTCRTNYRDPTSFICSCPPEWTGKTCKEDVDECNPVNQPYQPPNQPQDPSPCLNGGKCVNLPGAYRCDCAPKYYGKNCENVFIACKEDVCMNGGTCVEQSEGGYTCKCFDAIAGLRCQIDLCLDLQCLNGGKCVTSGQSVQCKCPAEYKGSRCETKKDDGTQVIIMTALLVALSVFILIGMCIVGCICCRQIHRLQDMKCEKEELEEEDCEYSIEPTSWTNAVNGCKGMVMQHVNTYSYGQYGCPNEMIQRKV